MGGKRSRLDGSILAPMAFAGFVCLTVAVNLGLTNPLPGARVACRWRMFTRIARLREVRIRVIPRTSANPSITPATRELATETGSWWHYLATAREVKLRENLQRYPFAWQSYAAFLCRQRDEHAESIQLLAEPPGRPDEPLEVFAEWSCTRHGDGTNP